MTIQYTPSELNDKKYTGHDALKAAKFILLDKYKTRLTNPVMNHLLLDTPQTLASVNEITAALIKINLGYNPHVTQR